MTVGRTGSGGHLLDVLEEGSMTGRNDRPDVRHRRRVGQIRAKLGLAPVPPYVGAELQTITAVVAAQVQVRLAHELPRYAVLSPEEQQRLLITVSRAVDEFARIVENRPLDAPFVGATLMEIARDAAHPERFVLTLHTALESVRAVMRDVWPTLTHARSHAVRLDLALARYVEQLGARAMSALHPPTGDPHERRVEAQLSALVAVVERRWPGQPIQLCLGLIPLVAEDGATPAAQSHPIAADRREAPHPVRLVATDHILLVTAHQPRAAELSVPVRSAAGVLWGGPVPAGEVAEAYQTALLMFRLVGAGVATPPPTPVPLPNLGFLRARPSEAAVAQITELLRPLTRQSAHRRATLARTLQLRLRTGGTARALAEHLGLHAQSARNHLGALRKLFDNQDLDFGQDTLTIQAALDLVLPLWEHESPGHRGPR